MVLRGWLLVLLVYLPFSAFAEEFVAGKDYQVITQQNVQASGPQVMEFFSYGCPWCYKIDNDFLQWQKAQAKSVQIERIPVVFHPNWGVYAKAYYTVNALGASDQLDSVIFKTIHEDKKTLDTSEAMESFLVSHGLDKDLVTSAFQDSPTIELRMVHGINLMRDYQINAIPAFVVNNKYKTDLEMAKSTERLFKILSYLLKQPG